MSHKGRIVAVDHVELEIAEGTLDDVLRFYEELADLKPVATDGGGSDDVVARFRSDRIEMRIRVVAGLTVDSVPERLRVDVPSLEELVDLLDEARIPYEWQHGLSFTDQCISVLDPSGNRVTFRKHWPQKRI